jgi:N-succinyldiaminopimelate aminotransferase
MPVPTQIASIAAWQDEDHVKANRSLYREKFSAFLSILDGCLETDAPQAGFYLWPKTPYNCEQFALDLFEQKSITCLPGNFISRHANGMNPGDGRVRMALVASLEECKRAAERIKQFVQSR